MQSTAPEQLSVHHPASPPWLWILTMAGGLNPFGMGIVLIVLLVQQASVIAGFGAEQGGASAFVFAMIYLPLMFFSVVLPALSVGLGSWVVFFPGVRGRWVEKKYSLELMTEAAPFAAEIRELARLHVPDIEITANLLRPGQLAFVYPMSRGGRLAIFGGLIRLWQRDRQAARAVLVHELAHYRRGDALHLGTGSALELSLYVAAASMLLSFILWLLLGMLSASMAAWILIGAIVNLTGLAMIVAATWAAEFAADYSAALWLGERESLLRVLSASAEESRGWRAVLARLTHPPLALRCRMLQMRPQRALLWQNLLFPLFLLAKDILSTGVLIIVALMLGEEFKSSMVGADGNSSLVYSAGLSSGLMFSAAFFLLLWPRLYPRYSQVWLKRRLPAQPVPAAPYRMAALLSFVLALCSGLTGVLAHDGLGLNRHASRVDVDKLLESAQWRYTPPPELLDPQGIWLNDQLAQQGEEYVSPYEGYEFTEEDYRYLQEESEAEAVTQPDDSDESEGDTVWDYWDSGGGTSDSAGY